MGGRGGVTTLHNTRGDGQKKLFSFFAESLTDLGLINTMLEAADSRTALRTFSHREFMQGRRQHERGKVCL